MSYATEHPDWIAPSDFDLTRLEKLGFEDISWKNDECPFFLNEKRGLNLHVDYQKEMNSQFLGDPSKPFTRYYLFQYERDESGCGEYDLSGWNADLLIASNAFTDVIKAQEGETAQ